MSIVKDLVLISLFLFILVKYVLLYKDLLKQRNFFINTLSHDLRVSTIAQIRGLELLEKNNNKQDLIPEIQNSCKFTLDMINMLLNTFQHENGEKILNYTTFNLMDSLNFVCSNLSTTAKEKDLEFCYRMNKNLNINGDKLYIEKVLSILLSTAIYNSRKNSSVYITGKKRIKDYKISIIYGGNPLSEEEQRRMFSRNSGFSTVGHGIKMLLCKKIIDFHKGKIFVKNNGKDINSFTFTIPCKETSIITKSTILSTLEPSRVL